MAINEKWYDKTWLVILLCIFFWPVGLYALWQNKQIGIGWKIAVSAFFGYFAVAVIVEGLKNQPKKEDVAQAVPVEVEKKSFKEMLPGTKWIALDSIQSAYVTKDDVTDANGVVSSAYNAHTSPILLTFTKDEVTLEVPQLQTSLKVVDIVHIGEMRLANDYDKATKFKWDYDVDEANNTITIDNDWQEKDFNVKYINGKLHWPYRYGTRELVFVQQ